MWLKKAKRAHGRTYLSIVQNYRRPEDGKTTTRTLVSCGYLDELEKEHDDPVAHFEALAAEMTAEHEAARAPATIEVHPAQKIDKRAVNRKNVGAAVLKRVYDALGAEKALRNATAGSNASYDHAAVMRLLVLERLLDPGSKLAAWRGREGYFMRSDFSDDDLYRALDGIAAARDAVVAAANRSVGRRWGRDASNVFYDVTNYYFERDPDDGPEGLVKTGVCKEGRPNPIVQMGLLQDADAIPISYRLHAGNTADCDTMMPALADMKRDLGVRGVTAVADKGLNCSKNMAALVAGGDHFVFSQSIRGTKSASGVRARALDPSGYVEVGDADGGPTFRRKSWQGVKTVRLKAEDTADGKARDVGIEVKFVAFWSRKYERRARARREKVLEKSRELVASPGKYTRATHCGAAKYVKGVAFDKETGEAVESGAKPELDLEAIAEAEACDGYYLIVTSHTDWDDGRIIDTYRGLWQIEESFKVTKSELDARPVFVWTPEHVEAHFLTCYIALVILRVLQKLCPGRPSAGAILDELRKVECSADEANWWLFDYRSDLTEQLFSLVGLEHPLKHMQTGDIRKMMQKDDSWAPARKKG